MSKKTVVQILRAPMGGIRKHVYDILMGLPIDEFDHIFITNVNDADCPVPVLPNITVHHVPISEQPSILDLQNLLGIYRYLWEKKVDAIHGHGAKGGLYARIISYLLRCKCFYTPHGGSLHRVHGKFKNLIYDAIEVLLIPFTDKFVFESGYSRHAFFCNILDVDEKAIVNYNGIVIPEKKSAKIYIAGQTLRLASFGLLRHLKGHDIVIEALALLKLQGVPATYSIYGKGEESEKLAFLIEQKGLKGFVTLLDYTNDVPEEMLKYDFIVHPSRFESFGYVPVEAMAIRVPVISSWEGGLKEVVDERTGFVCRMNTPEEYATILSDLYFGRKSSESRTEQALAKVQACFSQEKMLATLAKVYS